MRTISLLSLLVVICFSGNSQTVKVVDKVTLAPLSDVVLLSKLPEASATTNKQGLAEISFFRGSDKILISHLGYLPQAISFAEIEKQQYKIFLSEHSLPLNEIVVSASRFEEPVKDIAQPVEVIKSKDLAFINQPTSAEVLQSTGNVMVQKSQQGGGSPIIRGFETNKVLIVVDGVRMNNAIYRGGHLQNVITLDHAIMEKVEIVFGPGSVVYGSDALGGVMHFYTRDPSLLSEPGKMKTNANAYIRYATAAKEETGHFDFNLGFKKIASLTSVTFSDFDDLRQGAQRNPFYGDWGKRLWYVERKNDRDSILVNDNPNIQKQSGYKQYDVLQKFLIQQNDKINHVFNFQYSTTSDIPRYDRLTLQQNNIPRFAEWYYGPQVRVFGSYTLNFDGLKGFFSHGKIVAGYQRIEESRHDRRYNNPVRNNRKEILDIITLNADFTKSVKSHEIRYGFEAYHNGVESSAFAQNIETGVTETLDTRYPDGGSTMQGLAGYLTHAYEFSKKTILNSGLRFSYVGLHSRFDDTTFFNFPFSEVTQKNTALNGHIGIVYMPFHSWRFTVLGSSGFRAPNVDDLSKVFESNPGQIIVPNPDIKPEYTYTLESGISKVFNEAITLGGNGYYTWYVDAITTVPGTYNGSDSVFYAGQLSQVKRNDNISEAYIYGWNAYLQAGITPEFSITSSLNYTFGRIKTDSSAYPLDHIPPLFGKTSFIVKLKKFKGEFFVMYHGAKKSKDYNLIGEDNHAYSADPARGYMPAWFTLNIRCGYQFNRQLGLHVAFENITDNHYRVFASNIGAPGRNLVMTIRGNF